jgi:oligosaccharide repeat unit polymerase
MPRYIAIYSLIIYSILVFFIDLYSVYVVSFYFFILFIFVDFYYRKSFGLIQLWLISFVYVINSEGVVNYDILKAYLSDSVIATKVIYMSNVMVLAGYYINMKKNAFEKKKAEVFLLKPKAKLFLVILVLLYIAINIPFAINAYKFGRNAAWGKSDSGFVLSLLTQGMGLLLPSVITYVYNVKANKSDMWILTLMLPVFAILLLGGTRFYFLFSFLGSLMVYYSNKKIKNADLVYLTPLVSILYISVDVMMSIRNGGGSLINAALGVFTGESKGQAKDFVSFVSSKMSPEGVILSFSKMVEYFKFNEYLYGESTGFIIYFWIPRAIWSTKPTMLGHWLIRSYGDTGYSGGHSASFGFCGDFYADFGVFGAVLLSGVLGYYFKYLENYARWAKQDDSPYQIIGAMIYPYVFFVVRSPITATMTFILVIAVFIVVRKIIFIKNKQRFIRIQQ